MKLATLYFMLLMLFLFLVGYKSPPNVLHAMVSCSEVNTHHIESRAAFEKLPNFLDLSINLEEDEILDLIKKVSVYTISFLFFYFIFDGLHLSGKNEVGPTRFFFPLLQATFPNFQGLMKGLLQLVNPAG
jgi:hypothetical protein